MVHFVAACAVGGGLALQVNDTMKAQPREYQDDLPF
jgi:hypothetical protein